jgi:hypothetical protein
MFHFSFCVFVFSLRFRLVLLKLQGMGAHLMRTVPNAAILFMIYEATLDFLS